MILNCQTGYPCKQAALAAAGQPEPQPDVQRVGRALGVCACETAKVSSNVQVQVAMGTLYMTLVLRLSVSRLLTKSLS